MFTINEMTLCLLVVLGTFYDGYHSAHRYNDKSWFQIYMPLYGLFVILPRLVVVLYAVTHMLRD